MAQSALSTKHIPTLLGLLILGAGLIGGIFLVNTKNLGFLPRASPETTPKSLKITNVTDTSFTVSWVTDSKTPGYLKYGTSPSNLSTTVTDDRDQISGSVGLFMTHHVTIRSLTAQTTYYFKVGTGTSELYDDNGSPYQTKTGSAITASAKTIYGNILSSDSTSTGGSLIYITGDTISPLSTIAQSSGSFVLSLAIARSKDGQSSANITDDTKISILVVSPFDNKTSIVDTIVSQAQPIPDITLGTNQDATVPFSSPVPETPGQGTSTEVASKFTSQLLSPPTEATGSATLQIGVPTTSQVFDVLRPVVSGSGPKNATISLAFTGTSTLSSSTKSSATGAWTFTPKSNLKNGSYTLTASTTVSGVKQTATANFSIATPAPTPKASVSATPVSVSSDSADLVTGSTEVTIMLSLAGVLFISSGVVFAYSAAQERFDA
jgi:hypothetical protein